MAEGKHDGEARRNAVRDERRDPALRRANYEMVETPEETGFADIECRLNLVEAATELFEDGGHAMAWCMAHI